VEKVRQVLLVRLPEAPKLVPDLVVVADKGVLRRQRVKNLVRGLGGNDAVLLEVDMVPPIPGGAAQQVHRTLSAAGLARGGAREIKLVKVAIRLAAPIGNDHLPFRLKLLGLTPGRQVARHDGENSVIYVVA